jgi:response regulator of citrate/malate metabolism
MASAEKKDVLIVDDDKDICEIFKIYCENMKCFNKIIVVFNGADAIHKLQNHKFGLIVLDMNMPKKSGLEVIQGELTGPSLNKKENVLVLSGNLDPKTVSALIQNGLINFLSKPVEEDDFAAKVKKMVS